MKGVRAVTRSFLCMRMSSVLAPFAGKTMCSTALPSPLCPGSAACIYVGVFLGRGLPCLYTPRLDWVAASPGSAPVARLVSPASGLPSWVLLAQCLAGSCAGSFPSLPESLPTLHYSLPGRHSFLPACGRLPPEGLLPCSTTGLVWMALPGTLLSPRSPRGSASQL